MGTGRWKEGLSTAWFLARKDVQYMLRERETLLWTFVMPIAFFYFIGTITGGSNDGSQPTKPAIAVDVPPDAGFLADRLMRRLSDEGLDVRTDVEPEMLPRYRRRLALPAGFTASVQAGEPVKVRFDRRGAGDYADLDELRMSLAVYTLLADLIIAREQGQDLTAESLAALDVLPRNVTLDVRPAGRLDVIPQGFQQAVPGTMVMFTMMLMLTTGAITLMIERKQGLLRRLASAPIGRGSVVLGKWGGRMVLGLVQLAFAMVVGYFMFGVDWGSGSAFFALVVVLVSWAALCASLGILLGSATKTEGQAVAIAVISTMALAALGGCWWPIEITPRWMQSFAMCIPTGWTMDALHRLVNFGDGPSSVVMHVSLLAGTALAAGALAARKFRFE